MAKPVIGFIGVGLMGHGMAKNIVEKGYPLVVMAHRNREPVDDLIARGASEVGSPKAMAECCDIIHLCVSGSAQVESIIHGPEARMPSGPWMMLSTCGLPETQRWMMSQHSAMAFGDPTSLAPRAIRSSTGARLRWAMTTSG